MKKPLHSVGVDLLVEDNQPLVFHIAMKIHRKIPVKQDLDDLIGYGMIGLVEAANKYDPKRKIEFSTFAYPRINGAIYDGLSKLSWMSRSRYRRLMKAKTESEGEGNLKVEPTLESVKLLDSEVAGNIIAGEDESAEDRVTRIEEGEALGRLIEELPDRERRIITMIYIEGLSLNDASERLGISKSWGSRMHARTLAGLATALNSKE
ncbi:MAG: sigma-70 family RNA polymerase sigma factor [Mariniblastus sp.]|nr:sigma-70 family RNA polymerase sigma factor [Mariniblastus sp.]